MSVNNFEFEVAHKLFLINKLNIPDVLIDIVKEYTYYDAIVSFARIYMRNTVHLFVKQIDTYVDCFTGYNDIGVSRIVKLFANEIEFETNRLFPAKQMSFDMCSNCGQYIECVSLQAVCKCNGFFVFWHPQAHQAPGDPEV